MKMFSVELSSQDKPGTVCIFVCKNQDLLKERQYIQIPVCINIKKTIYAQHMLIEVKKNIYFKKQTHRNTEIENTVGLKQKTV